MHEPEPLEDPPVLEFPSGTRSGFSQFVTARHRGGFTESGQLFVRPDGTVEFRVHLPPGAMPRKGRHESSSS